MEQFRRITIEDRELLAKYLAMSKHRACDYSVGNLVLWSEVYNTEYTVAEDMLIIRFMKNNEYNFAFPMGGGDLKKAFEWILDYCKKQKIDFIMNVVEPEMFERVEEIFPGKFQITYNRDYADYVYKASDLRELVGKKYNGKRNHINKFLKTNDNWAYETITDENTDECIEMVKQWCIKNKCRDEKQMHDEVCVLIRGLKNRKELNMTGGLLRTDDRVVAMTMGEKSDDDMFIVHFEKAFSDVAGAYPMINKEFVTHELSGYTYVNREEDMGVKGLRKAKESYYPEFMVQKGVLTLK